jgi:hypothetical protein
MSDVTQILSRMQAGDSHAAEHLLPLVYDELRRLAASRLAQEIGIGRGLNGPFLHHDAPPLNSPRPRGGHDRGPVLEQSRQNVDL